MNKGSRFVILFISRVNALSAQLISKTGTLVVKSRRYPLLTCEKPIKRELAIEFSRVTEAAALAGYKRLGRGNKSAADGTAVEAMRAMLNNVEMDGEIVIGEGEIDEAPMLFMQADFDQPCILKVLGLV